MTTAQQVAHVAQTVDWFLEGAFRPEGFNMDFEGMGKEINAFTSLAAAREWFERAIASASSALGAKTDAELTAPLPPGPIMGGMPKMAIVGRWWIIRRITGGAYGVCAAEWDLPPMPYMEM